MGAGRWGEGEKGTGRRRRRSKTRRKAGAQKHGENPALKNTAKYADGGSKSVKQREQVCVCVCARARVRVCVCARARARSCACEETRRPKSESLTGRRPSRRPSRLRGGCGSCRCRAAARSNSGQKRSNLVKTGPIWSNFRETGQNFSTVLIENLVENDQNLVENFDRKPCLARRRRPPPTNGPKMDNYGQIG